ncbi:MAG: hypothetical protein JW734_10015 [Candidatus Omnitrophica bacterium]|nr:hypothetical protein [Candidatus Omnitrophota bacterium]
MEKIRSEGVSILGGLAFFMGIFTIVTMVSYTYYLSTIMPSGNFYLEFSGQEGILLSLSEILFFWFGIIGLALGILYCISAYGVLKLRNTWRIILVILSVIFIFLPFISFFCLSKGIVSAGAEEILVPGATSSYQLAYKLYSLEMLLYHSVIVYTFNIIFFSRPRIKEQFR